MTNALNRVYGENWKRTSQDRSRAKLIAYSNGWEKRTDGIKGSNKNWCTSTVAKYFEVNDAVEYLHTELDVMDALRTKYDVVEVSHQVTKAYPMRSGYPTVNSTQKFAKRVGITNDVQANGGAILNLEETGKLLGYVILVDGHILALDQHGDIAADSDPRPRGDRRRGHSIYAVFSKKGAPQPLIGNKYIGLNYAW